MFWTHSQTHLSKEREVLLLLPITDLVLVTMFLSGLPQVHSNIRTYLITGSFLKSRFVLYYVSFTAHFICHFYRCLLQRHLVSPFRWRCAMVWAIISLLFPTYGSPLLIRERLLTCFVSTVYVTTPRILLVMFNLLSLLIYLPPSLWAGADRVGLF